MDRKIHRDETIIEQLPHEIAILKRDKFAKRSEQMSPTQGSLLDDLLNTYLEAIEAELKALHPASAQAETRKQPKRAPLPPQSPRTVIHHEPDKGCVQRLARCLFLHQYIQRVAVAKSLADGEPTYRIALMAGIRYIEQDLRKVIWPDAH